MQVVISIKIKEASKLEHRKSHFNLNFQQHFGCSHYFTYCCSLHNWSWLYKFISGDITLSNFGERTKKEGVIWASKSFSCMGASWVARSCPTLYNPMNCSPPGSSVHGIAQARILAWVAISFSKGIFITQGLNPHLLLGRWILYHWATWEAPLNYVLNIVTDML